jgi:HlyD family secretion protein
VRLRRGHLAAAAAAGIALAAGYWLLRPAALPVDVSAVQRGALRVTVDEEGETRVRERFVVAAPTTGRLLRIGLDEGASLEPGQLVAQIQPAPLDPRDLAAARARLEAAQAVQHAAEARVVRARAALEQAQRSAARAERLHRAGTLSDDALEQTSLARTSAEQEHEAARFAADAADHDVEAVRAVLIAASSTPPPRSLGEDAAPCDGSAPCVEVRTPVAGRVLRVLEESERIVAAGTPLVEVGDPASLEIVIDILSEDAVQVRPGARVWIEDWGGEGALEARVRLVEPSAFTKVSALGVEEQRVNVIADLVAPEPRLGDRYRVEARIVVWEAEDVLQIPASALFRSGESWSVFTIEDGSARQREVEVGHQAAFEAEIRRGLEPGEPVILSPSDRVRDGSRVVRR